MNRKELTETFMMISNWSPWFKREIQRFKGSNTRKGCSVEHASELHCSSVLQVSTILTQSRFNAGPPSPALANILSTLGSESCGTLNQCCYYVGPPSVMPVQQVL